MIYYRVWHCVNFPSTPRYYNVNTPEEGAMKINNLSKRDIRKNVFSNAFGLEVFEDGEWCEWYDEDGNDIEVMADALLES